MTHPALLTRPGGGLPAQRTPGGWAHKPGRSQRCPEREGSRPAGSCGRPHLPQGPSPRGAHLSHSPPTLSGQRPRASRTRLKHQPRGARAATAMSARGRVGRQAGRPPSTRPATRPPASPPAGVQVGTVTAVTTALCETKGLPVRRKGPPEQALSPRAEGSHLGCAGPTPPPYRLGSRGPGDRGTCSRSQPGQDRTRSPGTGEARVTTRDQGSGPKRNTSGKQLWDFRSCL